MIAQRYVARKVSEVKPGDARVAIVGRATPKGDDAFELEDESGRVEVFCDTAMKDGLVRAFCASVDGRLKADAVQSLNGLDLNLYQKAQELYRKVGL